MSKICYIVNGEKRSLDIARTRSVFVEGDKFTDSVEIWFPEGFEDMNLDTSLVRVMYNTPTESEVQRAALTSFYNVDDVYRAYTWNLNTLTNVPGNVSFAICLLDLASDGQTVEYEWHTTPAMFSIVPTIHGETDAVIPPDVEAAIETQIQALRAEVSSLTHKINNVNGGLPTPVSRASEMVDISRLYLYNGSETGMQHGYWYYYDRENFEWTAGAQYGAHDSDSVLDETSTNPVQNKVIKAALDQIEGAIPEIDATLSTAGKAADAKKTGDEISKLKEDLNSIRSNPINLFEMKGLIPNGTKTDITVSGNLFTVATNQSAQYSGAYKYVDLKPNTTYCISCIGTKNLDTSVISAYYAESTDGGETYPSSSQALFSNRASGRRYITYFTTTTGKVRLAFYCTTSTTASGSVTYSDIILTEGLDYYGYFVTAGGAVDASANRLSEMVFSKLAQGFGREFTQADVTQASTTRLNISNLSVTDGDILVFHRGTNPIEMLVECYNGSTFVKQFDYVKGTNHLLIDHTGTIKIVLRKEGNATIAVSDYDAQITLISGFNVKDYVDTSVSDAVTETKDYTDSAISDALTNIDDAELIPASSIIQGAYVRDGSVQTNSKRIRTAGLLDINIGDKIIFKSGTVATGILCGFINDFMSVKETAWVHADAEITSTTTGKLVIMFRNTDNTAITPEQYDAVTKIKRAKQFYAGMSKYNGSVFRLNYAEAIPYPVRNSNTYSVTYANFIYEYTKLINRITTLYSDVSDLVPKPITAVKTTLRTAGSYDIVKITFTPAYPKKRIFMIAGTHGNEYESIYGLLNFVKALYAERYTYPQLTDFRNDVELVIIPVVNPYGFEHNTKLNADGLNIYNYYSVTDDTQPMEIRAVKDVFTAGGIHYFLDMHTDPYNSTSQKGCYVYAYIDSTTFPHAYNLTMRYREILYDEFGYSAKFLSSNKDIIVGRIDSINSSAGIAYAERRSIPANLAEISTGYGWGGSGESGADPSFPSFAPYGSADMVRICTEWYANVVLTMYKNLLVA